VLKWTPQIGIVLARFKFSCGLFARKAAKPAKENALKNLSSFASLREACLEPFRPVQVIAPKIQQNSYQLTSALPIGWLLKFI
jgi:hypothetical protein